MCYMYQSFAQNLKILQILLLRLNIPVKFEHNSLSLKAF